MLKENEKKRRIEREPILVFVTLSLFLGGPVWVYVGGWRVLVVLAIRKMSTLSPQLIKFN